MSHDTAARNVFGVRHETIVRRILRTWDRATASDIESGARWYDEAGDLARALAGDSDALGTYVSPGTGACIIAALSPRTSWSRNVATAVALVRDGEDAALALGAMRRNVATAVDAAHGGYDALRGPKTNAFARNINGDREAVTVDVWACRVADLDEDLLKRKGAYDAVAHAYRLAARRRGVDPATMQATTWIVARNGRAS